MRVIKDGDFYKLARITGPTHNMLSLRYGSSESEELATEVLDGDNEGGLAVEEVKEQVLAGVLKANQLMGTDYNVQTIQFLRGDSPPVGIYCELACHLTTEMDAMTKSAES